MAFWCIRFLTLKSFLQKEDKDMWLIFFPFIFPSLDVVLSCLNLLTFSKRKLFSGKSKWFFDTKDWACSVRLELCFIKKNTIKREHSFPFADYLLADIQPCSVVACRIYREKNFNIKTYRVHFRIAVCNEIKPDLNYI